MKHLCLPLIILFISCGNSNANKKETDATAGVNAVTTAEETQSNGIVGEWEQQYTAYDKNNNYKLDPEEKKASGVRLGFNWFKFNAGGTCLRDKDLKFEGTYKVEEKNGERRLVIEGGDNLRYSITELTENELILGADGAFIVFKRIK